MKPGLKELIASDLIIIDTEGTAEGLDLTEMKLDLNTRETVQSLYLETRKKLFNLNRKLHCK